jgi:hypothetical protein
VGLSAAWNNPAGGIRYHARALRHSQEWQGFRAGLRAWLGAWQPARTTLALVGPSAGHCLPLDALAQFERFVIFEIDPVARFLLKRRFQRELPERPIVWQTRDVWLAPILGEGPHASELLDSDCAVLFANIIGQVPYLIDTYDFEAFSNVWRSKVLPWLERTPWASFHDRVSGDVAPSASLPEHHRQLTDAEVTALYAADPSRSVIELNDHRSQELLPPGDDYHYLHWPLTHAMHHLIECTRGGRNR